MPVRIRLQRRGRRNRPFYRIVISDSKKKRNGMVREIIGFYDPLAKGDKPSGSVKRDRYEYWLSVGAQPTDAVRNLVRRLLKEGGE